MKSGGSRTLAAGNEMSKMRVAIIANPVSGRGQPYRKLRRLIREWPHADWEASVIPTRGPEHAGLIAREIAGERPDILAVCGGDGTVREVASALPDPPFPVLLIPGGTANVLARELGLPLEPTRALEVGLRGRTRRVDLGLLRARDVSRFLLFVGVGFDACVAARVRPRTKKRIGIAAYHTEVMRSLLTYNFPQFEVEAEDASYAASSCMTANSRYYGGGLALTPAADMCDGELDVLIVQTRRKSNYARLIWAAFFGRAPEFPWLLRRRVRRLRVTGPRGLWVQADGEIAGTLPLELDLEPASFPLIVPGRA